jgi:hypothetical protein
VKQSAASAALSRIRASADAVRWAVMNMRRSVKIMRLIDADKLKYAIHCAYSDDLEILEKIDEQSTAFDVNKVIGELKRDKFIESECILSDVHQGYNAGLSRAIEIVKGGGVE